MLKSQALCSVALAAVFLVGGLGASAAQPTTSPPVATVKDSAEDTRFKAFLDAAFDESLKLSPESQTALGIKDNQDRLDDYTDAGAARAQALSEAQLARMKREFSFETLGAASQLSWRLFEDQVKQGAQQVRWRSNAYAVSTGNSPTSDIPVFLINMHRVDSVQDARAYIARLKDVDRVLTEISARVRDQASKGVIAPKFVFAPVQADARNVLRGAPFTNGKDSELLADFRKKVEALKIPGAEKVALLNDAESAMMGPFRHGYETMLTTLAEIDKKAVSNDGVWRLPDGEAYYAAQLRYFTTTDMTPEQIHATGLAEVARIHAEMEIIKNKVGFKGTLQQFFAYVKTDPKFHYPNTEAGKQQYLSDARGYIAQVMAAAPRYFHRLPKAALDVRAVEPFREQTASVAFYNPPAPDGSRPGIYYVNLADMNQVLKPQIEGITYHEGAPGHHFQIAFAQEQGDLPKFRKFGFYGAYTEGWGLYAEQLGKEMGFYQDPYSDFGRLSLELWRATRLVTDSGMHAKRWTREQAIEYFKQNTLLSDRDIVKEVERYLVWPGQATSYKTGQLKILALRAKARKALGDRFDIRDFHQVVLGSGALPLGVLEEQVDAYIAEKSAH